MGRPYEAPSRSKSSSRSGLSREEVCVLASLAADLKISEVVDLPHVLVSMPVPESIFRAY